ncbi:b167 [Murid betaherpesvirus 8]|uniref:B167 n=2 Tax=Rat cytomegalovirus (isolate England) TaxID=1261657 RepID=K7XY60_RCMVE|nr:e167 [Murid betaherpesvirus 8]AKE44315.1 a167 [Rat cytomegalovirus ALL-03]AFX83465.1 e167 [Murid betaherpesvirus 8]AKB93344.1 b167 [Murid betaherpesvirus 8]WEG71937.1 membrane protein m167 [Murid betaherpesvirus 8]WPH25058.1 b167 [Murid betaherpesvirus 8]
MSVSGILSFSEADSVQKRAWWWLFLGWITAIWCLRPIGASWDFRQTLLWEDLRTPHITTAFRGSRTIAQCAWKGSPVRLNGSWWQVLDSIRNDFAQFERASFRWINGRRDGGAWAWRVLTSNGSRRPSRHVDPISPPVAKMSASVHRLSSRIARYLESVPEAKEDEVLNGTYLVHSWVELPEDFVGTLGCGVSNWSSEVPVAPAPSLSWEEASPSQWAVNCRPRKADPRLSSHQSPSALIWWLNGSLAASMSSPLPSWGPQLLSVVRRSQEVSGPGSGGFSYAAIPIDWDKITTPPPIVSTTEDPETYEEQPFQETASNPRPWFDLDTVSGQLLLSEEAWALGRLCVSCAVHQHGRTGVATTMCRQRPPQRKRFSRSSEGFTQTCAWSATASVFGGIVFGMVVTSALALRWGARPPRRGSIRLHNAE